MPPRNPTIEVLGVETTGRTLDALKLWSDLRRSTTGSQQGGAVDWSAVTRMAGLTRVVFRLERERLRQLLKESDELLRPLGDPLHVNFGVHRWLAGDREEAYSDWLQWIVLQLKSPQRVFRLFDTPVPPVLHNCTDLPNVKREEWVPEGHAGHTGRLDLVIGYEQRALLVVEVKVTGADAADTLKQEGYRTWLDVQHAEYKPAPVLLAIDAIDDEYHGGFRFVSWAQVCLQLRWTVRALHKEGRWLTAAMILAFVGAVEQNLLGFTATRLGDAAASRVGAFNTSVVSHLEAFLRQDPDTEATDGCA